MRRAAEFLVRNWPLKVGAIFLATVLYSGLVLGQNVRTWTGSVAVEPIRQPSNATLLSDLQPVTVIRYRAPLDVGVLTPASFRATIDLSTIEPSEGGPEQEVAVIVDSLDPQVDIVDFQPQTMRVQMEPVEERQLQVNVEEGPVPAGLNLGPAQVEPSTITIRGAVSNVNDVADVIAPVTIDASALNVDREVALIPVDANGNQVLNVEVEPERVRVRIAVARQLANRTLPVVPQLSGQPAPGYRITSLSVDPLVVTVSGEEATVTQLDTALTSPIDVSGRTTDLEATTGFELPQSVSITGDDRVTVRLVIAQETGTRTFVGGVVLTGASADRTYSLATSSVAITLGGPLAALDVFDASTLVATGDVSGLGVGTHAVTLELEPPPGMQLVAISPEDARVDIGLAPQASPDGI